MARANAAMFAHNRGEISKEALARVDVEKLRLAAECQLNWLPTVLGPMMLRPGLQHINGIKDDAANLMIPFVFSKFDTALIDLTPNVMRIEIHDVLVSRVAVSTVVADPNMAGTGGSWSSSGATSDGASVTIAGGAMTLVCSPIGGLAQAAQLIDVVAGDHGKEHGLRLQVLVGPVTIRAGLSADGEDVIAQTSLDTGWHSIAFTPAGNFTLEIESTAASPKIVASVQIDSAGVLEIPTPWPAGVLESIRTDQSGDVIYCAAYRYPQYKIERRGRTSWSVVSYQSDTGPFSGSSAQLANLTPGGFSGRVSLFADRLIFKGGHVGAVLRLFSQGQQNRAVLGAANAFSRPVRVTGVGTVARDYSWSVSGTYGGHLTLQRSFDGPTSGFSDVVSLANSFTGNQTSATGGFGGISVTPPSSGPGAGVIPLDNVICWERIGFKGGAYASGTAVVESSYSSGGGFGRCRIVEFISAQVVIVDVLQPFTSLNATNNWQIGDWNDTNSWPTSVGFFEGRLHWSTALNLWGSQPDNFTGYAKEDDDGNPLGDNGAILETFGSGPVDSVNWLLPLTRLLAGRDASIESIRSSSFDEVLTPTNISTKPCSTQGAARLRPMKVDKRGVFVSEAGRVYDLTFDGRAMDYSTSDLTRLNPGIYKTGFVDTAVQRQPDTMLWLPKGDGQAAALLYETDDDVMAWWRVQTLGVIERFCVLPAPSGIENFVYLTVKRTVNGVTRRFREKFAARANCIGGSLNQLLDCHGVYQGAPAATMSLPWLPNTTVVVWADGSYRGTATTNGSGVLTVPGAAASTIVAGLGGAQVNYSGAATGTMTGLAAYEGYPAEVFAGAHRVGPLVVSGGAITLPNGRTETDLTAFFGFAAPYMSAKLAYAALGGSAVNQKKKIDHLGLVLFDTHIKGLAAGQRMDVLDPLPAMERDIEVDPNHVYEEYDEPAMEVPGEWNTDARLCMLAMAPYPAKVAGTVISITTNEKI